MRTNKLFGIFLSALLCCITVASSTGCASHRDVTTVETRTVSNGDPDYRASADLSETRTTTTKTESVHEDHDDPDRGLFGIVGNIIALPFRAVGALFEAIF